MLNEKDCNGAIADCTEAIRLNPRYAVAYGTRGAARAEKGDFEGAVRDFESALEMSPLDWPNRKLVRELLEKARR